jgi:hypothetical protein
MRAFPKSPTQIWAHFNTWDAKAAGYLRSAVPKPLKARTLENE